MKSADLQGCLFPELFLVEVDGGVEDAHGFVAAGGDLLTTQPTSKNKYKWLAIFERLLF
ncbi:MULTISPECIES: hypothetical protein [unclassified Nitrospina]|uniref:hypothetical protein n=1 Tax=unclassified Nitrospina TaxID=2638683 RepID=UPI003F99BA0E